LGCRLQVGGLFFRVFFLPSLFRRYGSGESRAKMLRLPHFFLRPRFPQNLDGGSFVRGEFRILRRFLRDEVFPATEAESEALRQIRVGSQKGFLDRQRGLYVIPFSRGLATADEKLTYEIPTFKRKGVPPCQKGKCVRSSFFPSLRESIFLRITPLRRSTI